MPGEIWEVRPVGANRTGTAPFVRPVRRLTAAEASTLAQERQALEQRQRVARSRESPPRCTSCAAPIPYGWRRETCPTCLDIQTPDRLSAWIEIRRQVVFEGAVTIELFWPGLIAWEARASSKDPFTGKDGPVRVVWRQRWPLATSASCSLIAMIHDEVVRVEEDGQRAPRTGTTRAPLHALARLARQIEPALGEPIPLDPLPDLDARFQVQRTLVLNLEPLLGNDPPQQSLERYDGHPPRGAVWGASFRGPRGTLTYAVVPLPTP